jgi:hypothetical protein
MHETAFADAARPTRAACLRLPLLPYSLGHECLLLQERNPLLCIPEADFQKLPLEQQIFAIKRAALICSKNWAENHRPERWLNLWGWLTRKSDYPLAIADFRAHLRYGRALLPLPDKESDEIANGEEDAPGRENGAPLLAQLYLFAVKNRLASSGEVWDCGYALTAALYFTQLEDDGRLRIQNRKEWEIEHEMAEHRAATARDEAEGKIPGQKKPAKPQPSKSEKPPKPPENGLATPPPDV